MPGELHELRDQAEGDAEREGSTLPHERRGFASRNFHCWLSLTLLYSMQGWVSGKLHELKEKAAEEVLTAENTMVQDTERVTSLYLGYPGAQERHEPQFARAQVCPLPELLQCEWQLKNGLSNNRLCAVSKCRWPCH